jgi:hypothetical protein
VRAPVIFRDVPEVTLGNQMLDPLLATSEEIVRLVERLSVPLRFTAPVPSALVLAVVRIPLMKVPPE